MKKAQYTVTVSATEGGTATVNGAETVTVDEDTEVTLSAIPDEGYQFNRWTIGEDSISNEPEIKIVVTAAITYTAHFHKIEDTGIDNINTHSNDAVIYNILGRRVKKIEQRGIYIVNGKKIIIK